MAYLGLLFLLTFVIAILMGSVTLESAAAKIDRAKYHLQQLDLAIETSREQRTQGIRFDHKLQTDELVITALLPRSLFLQFALIAGEVIGQARSALEHAAWELTPSPKHGRTGFPVFTAKTKADAGIQGVKRYYDNEVLAMLPGINISARAIIESLQPFGPDHTRPLYVLNELWNLDKHKTLNFCVTYVHGIQLYSNPPIPAFNQMIQVPHNVKDGTELFRKPHPGRHVEVGAEVAMSYVVFDGGLLNQKSVSKALLDLVKFAERVIDDLAKTI